MTKQDHNNTNRTEPLSLIGGSLNEGNSRRLCLPRVVVAVIATLILWLPLAQAADFIPLGDLPGGDVYSFANDVSNDGTVVVGTSNVWDTDNDDG